MNKNLLILLFLLCSASLTSKVETDENSISTADFEEQDLYIFGTAIDFDSKKKIEGVKVALFTNGIIATEIRTDSTGEFEFFVELDQNYKIEFSKQGYVSKHIEIAALNVPDIEKKAGFSIGPINLFLFHDLSGIDYSVFDDPVAKFMFNNQEGAFFWDEEYGAKLALRIDEFKALYENRQKIHNLIDNWHHSAAIADEKTYFNSMTEDAIFLGTDKTERWEKAVFEKWAQPHFEKDKAWAFTASDRVIYFHDDNKIAWFEELLDTWMGTCRGSGVVILTEDGWKIKHYNLALLIDNDKMDKVIEVTK